MNILQIKKIVQIKERLSILGPKLILGSGKDINGHKIHGMMHTQMSIRFPFIYINLQLNLQNFYVNICGRVQWFSFILNMTLARKVVRK